MCAHHPVYLRGTDTLTCAPRQHSAAHHIPSSFSIGQPHVLPIAFLKNQKFCSVLGGGLEPPTPGSSDQCSNQLSYPSAPITVPRSSCNFKRNACGMPALPRALWCLLRQQPLEERAYLIHVGQSARSLAQGAIRLRQIPQEGLKKVIVR